MDTIDTFQSPSIKPEPRWGREDAMDRPLSNDFYRSRRSPGIQDRRGGPRGGRNRSRSPIMIDRYQPGGRVPRDDYYGQSRDHASRDREDRRRPPSPAAHIDRYVPGENEAKPPPPRVNVLPNPLSMEYQVGFNYFAEWWRVEQAIKDDKERAKDGGRRPPPGIRGERESREDRDNERAQIQAAYDAYKEELQVKMARTFVQQHKGEEWFKERYNSEVRDPFRQRLMEFRHGALSQWQQDLDSGVFDEFTLEGIYKAESNGVGGVVEREEGETVAAAEVLGVGDLVPSRGGDIRDDSALQPALLFKTLAPMVSREKIEGLCKEHLGEQEGGFQWLSLSDPNPLKKFHRIGWIMLHPGSQAELVTERGDGRDEDKEAEEGEDGTNAESKPPMGTAEKALEAINGKTIYDEGRGDFTCHVGVHVPPREPRKKALWDLFSAPERIDRDLALAKRLVSRFDQELGSGVDGVSQVEQRVEDLRDKGLLQPPATGPVKAKEEKDSDDGMEDEDDGEVDEGAFDDDDVDDEDLLFKKKTLDLLVEYLRRVFNFCFFCVFESDSVHELIRKCPGGHLRRPRASLSTAAKNAAKASALGQPFPLKRKDSNIEEAENGGSPVVERAPQRKDFKADQQLLRAFNWVKIFEEKILQILEPEHVDVKKLGGKPLEEGLGEELKKFVKQEDEAKFRCKVPDCTKLFKGESFWKKHVEKRHTEWLDNIKKDLNLVNTYVLDPSHIAPSRSDANSNGHFPMNNHNLTAGTPRGFNLANMPMMNNFSPGFPPQAGNMATPFQAFGNHTVTAPNGWMPGSAVPGIPGEEGGMMHQTGPMRRGGGRFNQRQGPYDRRNPNQNFNPSPRFGSFSGRLTPPRNGMPAGRMMMMMGGGAGKWGDGAGAQTVGPREAVQGRQLKSYEDLDAVGGGGSGELNY
ncbi:MAG: hypothetical protein LQ339_005097 [Xanthoria mediterranea]|nr:MAG: hypothetical protein LQ339_005097 [Xanthoria mediterranea]